MPDNTYKKNLAGLEDIAMDTNRNNEVFSRETSTGDSQNITKINARHIPITEAIDFLGAESVEDALALLVNLLNVEGTNTLDFVSADNVFVDGNLVLSDTNSRKLKDAGVSINDIINRLITNTKNLVIDGQFNHWDEGVSFTTTGYHATMWRGTETDIVDPLFERKEFTLGQTDVPDNPKYYAEASSTSYSDLATVNSTVAQQRLPGVGLYSNKTFTVSFWVKGSIAGDAGFFSFQNFGTSGSPSAPVIIEGEKFPVTTSWAKHSITFNTPSVAGKTLGADGNDMFAFSIVRALGTNFTGYFPADDNPTYGGDLAVTSIALVEGSIPFSGPFPAPAEERRRINPYFWYDAAQTHDGMPAIDTGSTSNRRTLIRFPVPMINTPAFSVDGDNGGYSTTPVFVVTANLARSTTTSTSSNQVVNINGPKADARL